MFETLVRLYDGGAIDERHLENAATRGWITVNEKEKILDTVKKDVPC